MPSPGCISPSVMLPEHRLAVLLQQFKDQQAESCIWHTSSSSPSLYSDHTCDPSRFPTEVLIEFAEPQIQKKEIWQVRFSHNGKFLAGCGSGGTVYIWDTETLQMARSLTDLGANGVGNIAWSPDDTKIVTCGRDGYARIWDVAVSGSTQVLRRHYC